MGETLSQAEIEALLNGASLPDAGAAAGDDADLEAGAAEWDGVDIGAGAAAGGGADMDAGADALDDLDMDAGAAAWDGVGSEADVAGGGAGGAGGGGGGVVDESGVAGSGGAGGGSVDESGGAGGGAGAGAGAGAAFDAPSDKPTMEEVEAGLEAFVQGDDPRAAFTPVEIDALGEIGNISMGNSATTLFSLLNRKVNITTPTVSINTLRRIAQTYTAPLVVVKVEYTEGMNGSNMLILRESDVMVITDLMMGGDGLSVQGDITELHLSAISEAMNQMIGNASTSLSNVFDMKIDISPPNAVSVKVDNGELLLDILNIDPDDLIAVVLFDMTVEGLLNTKIMQIQPFEFARAMVDQIISKNGINENASEGAPGRPPSQMPQQPQPQQQHQQQQPPPQQQQQQAPAPQGGFGGYQQQPGYAPPPQYAQPGGGYMNQSDGQRQPGYPQQAGYGPPPSGNAQPQFGYAPPPPAYVNVQPATFQPFDDETFVFDRKNIGLVMDVPLEVSVELGRTRKLIKDILEFGQGSIIELDKIAGEPVDILVNGKAIARGEVVVIDESFGVRVVDIIHPSKRIV